MALSGISNCRNKHGDLMVCLFLVIVAAVVFSKDITIGGLRWNDASAHAMDGVLIYDWVMAGPSAWVSPIEFAEQQYAHYPCLGIGRVYPPGFAVVESLFFLVFGISPVTARLCTVFFGIMAIVGCYRLLRLWAPKSAAACAAILLMSMPGITFWTRQTMLEMPTLAAMIWAAYAVMRYIEHPRWRRWVWAVLLLISAPLFKQTAIFIIPVMGLILTYSVIRRRMPVAQYIWGVVVVVVPLGVFYLLTLYSFSSGSTTHMFHVLLLDSPLMQLLRWESLSYYPSVLFEVAGWWIPILAAVGLVWAIRASTHRMLLVFPGLWLIAFYLMFTLIQSKEPRYLFFGVLPLAIWAGYAICRLAQLIPVSKIRTVLIAGVVSFATYGGYASPTQIELDFSSLVREYEDDIRGHVVFYEGHRDVEFIFNVRQILGPRKCVVVRGSKVVYACANLDKYYFESYADSPEQVADILKPFSFEILFAEQRNVLKRKETQFVMEALDNPQWFNLLATHRLSIDRKYFYPVACDINVYRPRDSGPRKIRYVDLNLPLAGRKIRVDLDQLMTSSE